MIYAWVLAQLPPNESEVEPQKDESKQSVNVPHLRTSNVFNSRHNCVSRRIVRSLAKAKKRNSFFLFDGFFFY